MTFFRNSGSTYIESMLSSPEMRRGAMPMVPQFAQLPTVVPTGLRSIGQFSLPN